MTSGCLALFVANANLRLARYPILQRHRVAVRKLVTLYIDEIIAGILPARWDFGALPKLQLAAGRSGGDLIVTTRYKKSKCG